MSNDANETPKRGRIDLAELEDLQYDWKIRCTPEGYEEAYSYWVDDRKEEILAELKRMYAREDMLLDALRIIRDDLDEAISQGYIGIQATYGIDVTKIRNFANDASK